MSSPPVTITDVEAAAARIAGAALRTPLVPLPRAPGAAAGAGLYAKAESLQRTGSFKFRGAYNALASLVASGHTGGVVADSSGNHAQGVAAAAALHGLPATIVMPENAAPVKVERTAAWGAEIVRCAPSSAERQRVALELAESRGLAYVPPFDDERIIAGQGTAGLEICEALPDVGTVVVCIGGGGLIAGIATAVKARAPQARVIGVEPELAADARDSFRAGRRIAWSAEDVGRTVCDGVRTQSVGERNFAVIAALVDDVVTVDEEAVLEAMRWYALEVKLVVEPTGALALAALRSGAVEADGPTVAVISGGNVDPALLSRVVAPAT